MAAQSNLKNMLICLTAVCLVCSALLAGVNALTAEPIKKAADAALVASISEVLPQGGELSAEKKASLGDVEYTYYELCAGEETLAYAVRSSSIGFGGPLVLMVGVLADGTVYNTSVLSHSETPGLGAKCNTDEHFYSQFRQLPAKTPLALSKDGGSLDAITASTITSRAYVAAVNNAVELVKTIGGQSNE